jgi:hypothetical protein
MTIHMRDEAIHQPRREPGFRPLTGTITLERSLSSGRELIRSRVRQEVERYNQALPEVFQGLVQPEESEQILNGFRMKVKRPLDWEAQCEQAYASFEKNGFLLLVNGTQVVDLDDAVELQPESEVEFVKLVPLVGG